MRSILATLGPDTGPLAAVAALVLVLVLAVGPIWAAVVGAAVLAGLIGARRSADRRMRTGLALQLPELAAGLAATLAAGRSLRQALQRAATETPPPLGREIERAVEEIEVGARVEDALERMAVRLGERDLQILATAIMVQRIAGGNLARSLGDLAGRLEERRRLQAEVSTATAQARMTAWLVALLPALGAVVVEGAAPGTLVRTLGHGPGLALTITSFSIQGAGALLVAHIVRSVR